LEEEERRVWDWFGGQACPGSAGKPISHEMVGMLTPTAEADLSGRGCVGGSKNTREPIVPSVVRALDERVLLKGCKGTRACPSCLFLYRSGSMAQLWAGLG